MTILDAGEWTLAAADCAQVVRAVDDGCAPVLAADRNAVCRRMRWPSDAGVPRDVVVKVPRLWPQRTNPDTTFAAEASILSEIAGRGIADASRLVARIAARGTHYLVVTHIDGEHPDPLARPFTRRHLSSVVDSLCRMDEQGLMHYDLKPANLLLVGDGVAYLDFEFARFEGRVDASGASRETFAEDFNVSANPHVPARTNVANFEFRTLQRYVVKLADASSAAAARDFFRDWLVCRGRWHAHRAGFFVGLAAERAQPNALRGGTPAPGAERRLVAAAEFERSHAGMLADPDGWVADIEWLLVEFRSHVFERRVSEARALRRELHSAVARRRCHGHGTESRYLDAVTVAVERIARSRVPGGTRPSVDFAADAPAVGAITLAR